MKVRAWIQSSILIGAPPFLSQKPTEMSDRLQVAAVRVPRTIECQANSNPFDTTEVLFAELENTLIRLCRELPPVVAAVECPPEMRAN